MFQKTKMRFRHAATGYVVQVEVRPFQGNNTFFGTMFTPQGEIMGVVDSDQDLDRMLKRLEGHCL